jgi:hypothetical protein
MDDFWPDCTKPMRKWPTAESSNFWAQTHWNLNPGPFRFASQKLLFCFLKGTCLELRRVGALPPPSPTQQSHQEAIIDYWSYGLKEGERQVLAINYGSIPRSGPCTLAQSSQNASVRSHTHTHTHTHHHRFDEIGVQIPWLVSNCLLVFGYISCIPKIIFSVL